MTDPLKNEDSVFEKSDPGSTRVNISLKAGPYESPWITLTAENCVEALDHFGEPLARLMRETAQAQASFMREYAKAKNANVPEPGTAGKPAEANTVVNTDIPFADTTEDQKPTCSHGDRKFLEKNGKKGWICPLPNGSPGRCAPVFV